MRIAVLNLEGGMAKSSVAMMLALEYPANIISNDPKNNYGHHLPDGAYYFVDANEPILVPDDDIDVIYDLGGFFDERFSKLLDVADVIIVPFLDSTALSGTQNPKWTGTLNNVILPLLDYRKKLIVAHVNSNKQSRIDIRDVCLEHSIHYVTVGSCKLMADITQTGIGPTAKVESVYNKGMTQYQLFERAYSSGHFINRLINLIKHLYVVNIDD